MSLFKRIIEINGKFIPQRYRFLTGWVSRDKTSDYQWMKLSNQMDYCSYKTIEDARNSFKHNSYKVHKA